MRVADRNEPRAAPGEARRSVVVHLPVLVSDVQVVAAIRAGEPAGGAALYDRHHAYVRRVLLRVLGPDADLNDLIQDVFVAAIDSIDGLLEPKALRGWLAAISVNCVRVELRRRTRGRLIRLVAPHALPEVPAPANSPDVDAAARATYQVLARLPPDERIPFALRFIDGMELSEVASACQVSLATTKRRLASAQKKFASIARSVPELAGWLSEVES